MIDWDDYHYVKVDTTNGSLSVNFDDENKPQLKLALKEVKLIKKALAADKRELTQQISELRAENRNKQAQRMHVGRGGGGLGKFMRTVQSASKAVDRSNTSQSVEPLEKHRAGIDAIVGALDQVALKLERLLL